MLKTSKIILLWLQTSEIHSRWNVYLLEVKLLKTQIAIISFWYLLSITENYGEYPLIQNFIYFMCETHQYDVPVNFILTYFTNMYYLFKPSESF